MSKDGVDNKISQLNGIKYDLYITRIKTTLTFILARMERLGLKDNIDVDVKYDIRKSHIDIKLKVDYIDDLTGSQMLYLSRAFENALKGHVSVNIKIIKPDNIGYAQIEFGTVVEFSNTLGEKTSVEYLDEHDFNSKVEEISELTNENFKGIILKYKLDNNQPRRFQYSERNSDVYNKIANIIREY